MTRQTAAALANLSALLQLDIASVEATAPLLSGAAWKLQRERPDVAHALRDAANAVATAHELLQRAAAACDEALRR